jgi:putative DNA primase/helicase
MSDQAINDIDSGYVPEPLTFERTCGLLEKFCETYPAAYAIEFRIGATQEELYGPQATRDRVGTIFGGYVPAARGDQERRPLYRGRCDLVYSVLGGTENLRKTLRHEIIGHFGLNTLSADDKRGVLESIALSQGRDGIAQKWAQAKRDYGDQPDLLIAEEVFCLYAENLELQPNVVQPPTALERIQSSGAQPLDAQDITTIAAHIATGLHERTRDQVIFPVDSRAQFSRSASDKADKKPFHEVVAQELIRQIEAGTAPWQKPWNADGGIGGMPINPTTGKRYKGINAIHLLAQGHSDPRWLTYKQATSLDAQVKKGERGTSIQYWKFEDTRTKTDEAGRPVLDADGKAVQERFKLENPRVFYATVFNAEQIDGLPPLVTPKLTWDPVERAESILANSGARILHSPSDRAYYSPARDEIHLPLQGQFPSARNYYATALHELGHWTGHESRLKRDLQYPFGSEGYAREELRAEIASMVLCAELGLPHDPSQHAAYVANWVDVLKKDPLEIFRAAADAEKIHALAMSFELDPAKDLNSETVVAAPSQAPDPAMDRLTVLQNNPPLAQPENPSATGSILSSSVKDTKVIPMPIQPLSAEDVRDALTYISPNLTRDDWARIGMAIKSEFPNELGLDLFDQWSSTGEGYNRNSLISTWRSIRADGPVKIGTLLKQAQDNGFTPRQDSALRAAAAPQFDPATLAANAAAAAKEQQDRLSQQESAASQALQMWHEAQPNNDAAYLLRKSIQAHGTRTTANGTLLVPLVDGQGTLWNVQRILPTKLNNGTDKLFLKGGRKSGLFHIIGDATSNPEQPILFAEGYATAASLHEATGWPAVVCLDAGNLIKVSSQFRSRFPEALMIVAGDDDAQTMATKGVNPGRQKASIAAEQTNAVLAFPQGLMPEHSDFNDLVAQLGTQAGFAQIRKSLYGALERFAQSTTTPPMTDIASGAMKALETRAQQTEQLPLPPSLKINVDLPVGVPEQKADNLTIEEPPATGPELSETQAFDAARLASSTSPSTQEIAANGQEQLPGTQTASATELNLPVTFAADAPRPDPINDLNFSALNAKRAREAEQLRQEMGWTETQADSTAPDPRAQVTSQGTNSVSSGTPAQEPNPNTPPLHELTALRERLAKEYQHDGAGKYFFRQGKLDLAFEDTGTKFNTPHHAPEVVASIAQLARAKGWREMHLTGTPEFRREMWMQASLLGIKAIGYEPEAIDQVRLTERRLILAKDQAAKTTSDAPTNSASSALAQTLEAGATTTTPITTSQDTKPATAPALLSGAAAKQLDAQLRDVLASKGANEPRAMEMTLEKLYTQVQSPRVYLGQLLEHGPAPYKFDPEEQSSYFVKLQTKTGVQTVWGVDLPRALAEMLPNGESAIGQDILLAFQGVKKVQALVPQKDAAGQPAPQKWELVDRNTWFAQPVMQAYAQSKEELSQMPSAPAAAVQPVSLEIARTETTTTRAAQAMQPMPLPGERLRKELTKMGADALEAEITLASMQRLFDSPKFQVGRLLEHGQAPLKFTDGQPLSYYLKLQTEHGPVLLWSADFPRAMNSNPVQLGQTIVVAYRGIDAVPDGANQLKPRNDWLVAPLERLHDDAQQGVTHHMANAQTMPVGQPPEAGSSQEQKSLYILREAMRQAGIPHEFAQATLKDAEHLLNAGQRPIQTANESLGNQGFQVIPTRTTTTDPQPFASVPRKTGPSL